MTNGSLRLPEKELLQTGQQKIARFVDDTSFGWNNYLFMRALHSLNGKIM